MAWGDCTNPSDINIYLQIHAGMKYKYFIHCLVANCKGIGHDLYQNVF